MIQNKDKKKSSRNFWELWQKENSASRNVLPLKLFLLFIIMIFGILAVSFKRLPPVVPFYYSLPWGEEQLVKSNEIFILPFSIIVIFLINFILSLTILKEDPLLVQIMFWTACMTALGALITLTKIILLVI